MPLPAIPVDDDGEFAPSDDGATAAQVRQLLVTVRDLVEQAHRTDAHLATISRAVADLVVDSSTSSARTVAALAALQEELAEVRGDIQSVRRRLPVGRRPAPA